MIRKNNASLKDVAAAAGVSTSLVSFVLNGKQKQYRVNKDVAERVKRIAKELNYKPNGLAKSLRNGSTKTIGVIVSDISNQFFADIARHIESATEEKGYMALFASSDENAGNMEKQVERMLSKEVDGLILVPCNGSRNTIELLSERNVPFVLLDRHIPGLKSNYVTLDNFKAGYDATMHLLQQGYSKISMVSYKGDLVNIYGRENGYRQAMRDANLEEEISIFQVPMEDTARHCRKAVHSIVEKGSDALLCATNAITIQCLRHIKDSNIIIPDDLALVGFDGGSVFDFFYAPLTYFDQPLELMARKSVDVLVEMLESGQSMMQQIEIAGKLIVRESSARKKQKK